MSAARSLAVSACFFTNSRAASGTSRFWSLVNASVTGAKASLTVLSTELVSVSVVIWVSPSSGLSYGLTPSGLARGKTYMTRLMVRCNMDAASRYHKFVIRRNIGRFAWGTGGLAGQSVRNGRRKPISFQLCPNLRHIVPEHDDVLFLADDVPDVIAQHPLRLEAQAFKQRDRGLRVARHLHRQFFEARAQRESKRLLRQRPSDALPPDIERDHHPDLADMGRPGK